MNIRQKEKLIQLINESFDVDILKNTRQRRVVDIRHCLSYALRKRDYTTTEIGMMIKRDHATVIHAERKVEELYLIDKDFTKLVNAVNDVIDSFFISNKIYGRKSHIEGYESIRMTAARLLERSSEYMDKEEVDAWMDRIGISKKEYNTFTSQIV